LWAAAEVSTLSTVSWREVQPHSCLDIRAYSAVLKGRILWFSPRWMLLALSFNGGSVLALHFVEYLEESTLKVELWTTNNGSYSTLFMHGRGLHGFEEVLGMWNDR